MAADEVDAAAWLSPPLAELWGLRERPRRGPKPGLSLERIVAAAIEVADADGIAALSMARVAKHLGFSTMSLYRYVATKDDLLVLMVDAAVGDPPDLAAQVGDDWRTGLRLWSHANVEYLVARPWIMQVAIKGPPLIPKQLAWMESALAVLAPTPLPPAEQVAVMQLVLVHALGQARLAIDLAAAQEAASAAASQLGEHVVLPTYGQLLGNLLDPVRHPALMAVVASGAFEADLDYDEDDDYGFGLDRVLDGIGMLIDGHRDQPV